MIMNAPKNDKISEGRRQQRLHAITSLIFVLALDAVETVFLTDTKILVSIVEELPDKQGNSVIASKLWLRWLSAPSP